MSESLRRKVLRAPIGLRDPSSYSAELEALRGLAILLVFFFHVDGVVNRGHDVAPATLVSPLLAFVRAGHTGVTLFFVLSGFLLSRPFLVEGTGGPRVRRAHFFERRALRILPLYWTWVLLSTALSARTPADLLHSLPYLFFLEPFAGLAPSLTPYSDVWWSLSTEAQFYLILPLLGVALRSRRGRRLGALALALYAPTYTAFAAHWFVPKVDPFHLGISLFGRGSAFLVGIAAAWLHDRHGLRIREACAGRAWLRNGGADVAVLLVLLALGMLLRYVVWVGFFPAEIWMPDWHLPEAFLWAAFVLAVLLLPLRAKRLLSNKPMRVVGLLSYSLYLCQLPVIYRALLWLQFRYPGRFNSWTPEMFAANAGVLVLCLGLSALTYRFVERPFLARKARLSD